MSEVINIKELNERIERESVFVDTLRTEMGKVIVGQSHLVDTLLIGLLSNGHILLEGVPGLAKTLAITTLAKAVDAIQVINLGNVKAHDDSRPYKGDRSINLTDEDQRHLAELIAMGKSVEIRMVPNDGIRPFKAEI